jgi:YjjG family noncanonical pyrimidine nucleotidase
MTDRAVRYTWLLFDADGTLFDYDRAEHLALERTLARFGVAMTSEILAIYRRVNAQMWVDFEQGAISAVELRTRRFELLFREAGLALEPSAFSDSYLGNLSQVRELLPGAQKVITSLHGRYGLAVVTNGLQDVQRPRLQRSVLWKYIDHLIISEEVGAAKPDPAYFTAALARIGNPPKEQVLLIGDNWGSDIEGAHRCGIDACWFNPGRRPRPGPVRYEIARLEEVLEILHPGPGQD